MARFNLETALLAAEAGECALWEDIARHLLKARTKPKSRKASSGPQTWCLVTLTDGREYLTSHYRLATDDATTKAHAAYAQYRASMEHLEFAALGEYRVEYALPRVNVRSARLLTDRAEMESLRERCFNARQARHKRAGMKLAA